MSRSGYEESSNVHTDKNKSRVNRFEVYYCLMMKIKQREQRKDCEISFLSKFHFQRLRETT